MQRDWTFCDGEGRLGTDSRTLNTYVSDKSSQSDALTSSTRRSVLALGSLGILGLLGLRRSALAQIGLSPTDESRDLLVVVFLRGGMDGLNAVPPYGEDAYHRLRPTLALASPKGTGDRAIDLDGFFGLHPSLAPFLPLYQEGRLGIIHAVGSGDQSRSHFEAMSAMERGLPNATAGAASGWLARYLSATQSDTDSPLRAVALGPMLPDSLRGGLAGNAIRSVADFRLAGNVSRGEHFEKMLRLAYADGNDEAQRAGRDTLKVLDALKKVETSATGSTYPTSELGEGLRQVSLLAKAGVGLEIATLDKGGFDTHVAQGAGTGWLAGLLDDVAKSLVAFERDMGERMKRTTVVVMTEFGRRAYENTPLGTDHGRGSAMFLLGGSVKGGKVYGEWPGLEKHQLEDEGDLRVTTDYRHVLAEVLERRMAFPRSEELFEGLRPQSVGLV